MRDRATSVAINEASAEGPDGFLMRSIRPPGLVTASTEILPALPARRVETVFVQQVHDVDQRRACGRTNPEIAGEQVTTADHREGRGDFYLLQR